MHNFTTDFICHTDYQNTWDFEDGMKTWHTQPNVDKTWNNFKLQFEDGHASLRRVRGTTMRSTAYHQANLLSTQVLNEVKEVKTSVTDALYMLSTNDENEENIPPPSENKANSALQNEGQREILQFLTKLQDEVHELKSTKNTQKYNVPITRTRKTISKYCNSHGACSHDSKDCKPQFHKVRHKEYATFENKMGGATDFCRGTNA